MDAHEHHKQTILKDEAMFAISDYKERHDLKCVTHLYGKREKAEREAITAKQTARAELRKSRRRGLELVRARRKASSEPKAEEK